MEAQRASAILSTRHPASSSFSSSWVFSSLCPMPRMAKRHPVILYLANALPLDVRLKAGGSRSQSTMGASSASSSSGNAVANRDGR
jgi:hypothetical protein